MARSAPSSRRNTQTRNPVPEPKPTGRVKKSMNQLARTDALYQARPGPDGYYFCPFKATKNCKHGTTPQKCVYDKWVDSHLKPFWCDEPECAGRRFSSTACVLRHEREAHAMHGHGLKPNQCPYPNCPRGVEGNGFPRSFNLRDHMTRVHKWKRPSSMSDREFRELTVKNWPLEAQASPPAPVSNDVVVASSAARTDIGMMPAPAFFPSSGISTPSNVPARLGSAPLSSDGAFPSTPSPQISSAPLFSTGSSSSSTMIPNPYLPHGYGTPLSHPSISSPYAASPFSDSGFSAPFFSSPEMTTALPNMPRQCHSLGPAGMFAFSETGGNSNLSLLEQQQQQMGLMSSAHNPMGFPLDPSLRSGAEHLSSAAVATTATASSASHPYFVSSPIVADKPPATGYPSAGTSSLGFAHTSFNPILYPGHLESGLAGGGPMFPSELFGSYFGADKFDPDVAASSSFPSSSSSSSSSSASPSSGPIATTGYGITGPMSGFGLEGILMGDGCDGDPEWRAVWESSALS